MSYELSADELARMEYEAAQIAAERDAYIRMGVCSQCGARNSEEAERLCTAQLGVTDEYSCAGDELWRETKGQP